MRIEQLYTKCLAQGAYYLSHKGEAALIDPLREVETYAALLKEDEAELKYVFETHFHADFVSGHLDISNKSGAEVVFGPGAQTQFPVHLASDGERFTIGDWTVQLLHTPGHTLESSCYLLLDPEGKPHALFTGDTLFLGDVGRPDLAQKMDGLSMEDLAGMSYDSLRNKIMPLPDELVLYPAHGAGSACGKNMMNETVDTLGNQRKVNYALRADMSKAEFIEEVTSGLVPPPAYFPENVRLNKEGSQALEKVMAGAYRPMGTQDIQQLMTHGDALLLDVRSPDEFGDGHIPGSLFIGLDGSFAPWVGELIRDVHRSIVLIAPQGREKEAITRLARVGFDHILGFLEGGMASWMQAGLPCQKIRSVQAEELARSEREGKTLVVDVRKNGEYTSEHMRDAVNVPLSELQQRMNELPKDRPFYLHCAAGYRSMIAASILSAAGVSDFNNVLGGYKAMQETDIEREGSVCTNSIQ
jgi:hydroxyacylglutathione hydrolase